MAVYKEAVHIPRVAYRVKELVAALGMSAAAVYQLIASGVVPCEKIGGRVFVPARYFRELGLEDPIPMEYARGARLGALPAYTVAEVAAALGSAIPNIYELTGRGVIPMVKEGGRRLIPATFFGQVGMDAPLVDLRKYPASIRN